MTILKILNKNKTKIFLLAFLFLFLFSPISQAAEIPLTPLVRCGRPGFPPCQLCHLFCMVNRIIDFFLFIIVPPIAALMLTIGGFMFFFAGGSPEKLDSSKKIIKSTVMGLFIVYGAWIFISAFLTAIGVFEWAGLIDRFNVPCP